MDGRRTIATAGRVGADAHGALRAGSTGAVAAVFARSFYLRFGDRWVCLGAEDIGAGPLNVVCAAAAASDWRAVGLDGLAASVAGDTLRLGRRYGIALSAARLWRPPDPPVWTRESLARGLAALGAVLPAGLPDDGLGCYAREEPQPTSLVARAAAPHVAAIAAWISAVVAASDPPPEGAVGGLLGLGPGLTPSGDDFLAGCLVALRAVGRIAHADALWRVIEDRAPRATVAISLAHLRCAGHGRVAERLHAVLHALLAGDAVSLRAGLDGLSRMGHNSPWDGLAGFATVLRASAAGSCRH